MFVFTHGKDQFKNLQTLSELARKSNGSLFFYPHFDPTTFGMKFTNELYGALTRSQAWEAVFRVRTTQGFNQVGTYGNYLIKRKTTDLVLCPNIDKDRVIVYEIERQNEATATSDIRNMMTAQKVLYL
jgi:hypothetical protein